MKWYKKEKTKHIGEDEAGNPLWEKHYITRTIYLGSERLPLIIFNHSIKSGDKK
jgi:Na+-transporting NADH:ubiquinone oxidoreductase subunit NqrC